jgi:phosphoglycerate dehydrogenase-like enzyme
VADPRLQTRGLLVTPHVGWSSPQANEAWRDEAIDSLRTLLADVPEPAAEPGRTADYAS